MSRKHIFITLVTLALLFQQGIVCQTHAAPISPTSYDMQNGQSGSFNYWDDDYNGIGNNQLDAAALSGGLGDLTNGVIATANWNAVEGPLGPNGPYVGWQDFDPVITFNFPGIVNIDSLTIHVDDSNGFGGVFTPQSARIEMGGSTLDFPITDPPTSAPISVTFSNLNLNGSTLELTLFRRPGPNNWVFLSEVEFEGSAASAVPVPSSLTLLTLGAFGWLGLRKRVKRISR